MKKENKQFFVLIIFVFALVGISIEFCILEEGKKYFFLGAGIPLDLLWLFTFYPFDKEKKGPDK